MGLLGPAHRHPPSPQGRQRSRRLARAHRGPRCLRCGTTQRPRHGRLHQPAATAQTQRHCRATCACGPCQPVAVPATSRSRCWNEARPGCLYLAVPASRNRGCSPIMANGYAPLGFNPRDCLPPASTGSSRGRISTQISTQASLLAGPESTKLPAPSLFDGEPPAACRELPKLTVRVRFPSPAPESPRSAAMRERLSAFCALGTVAPGH